MAAHVDFPPDFAPATAAVHTRNERTIVAGPGVVWAWLVRATRWPEFYGNAADVHIEGGAPDLAAGTVFRWRTFGLPLRSLVIRCDHARALTWDAPLPLGRALHGWVLEPVAGGTHVVTEEVHVGTGPKLLARFVQPRLHAQHDAWLDGLARVASDGPPTA